MSLQKKLDAAYTKGFEQACMFWEKAIERTPGIGVKRQEAIKDQVRKLAAEVQGRKKSIDTQRPSNH